MLQLEAKREIFKDDLTKFSAALQQDLDRFQQEKVADFKRQLLDYAIKQRRFFEKSSAAWDKAIEAVNQINENDLTL
jgi:hypothetical protein